MKQKGAKIVWRHLKLANIVRILANISRRKKQNWDQKTKKWLKVAYCKKHFKKLREQLTQKYYQKKNTEMVYNTVYFGIQYCILNCVFCEKESLVVDFFLTNSINIALLKIAPYSLKMHNPKKQKFLRI